MFKNSFQSGCFFIVLTVACGIPKANNTKILPRQPAPVQQNQSAADSNSQPGQVLQNQSPSDSSSQPPQTQNVSVLASAEAVSQKTMTSGSASASIPPKTYKLSGIVKGLVGSVVLQNNKVMNLTLSKNGTFVFSASVNEGEGYSVDILTQPEESRCAIKNGSGSSVLMDVTNIELNCLEFQPLLNNASVKLSRSSDISDIFVSGQNIYLAGNGGLYISNDNGANWSLKKDGINVKNALGFGCCSSVFAVGNTVYAVTNSGLSISRDGGDTWTTNFIGLQYVNYPFYPYVVFASGPKVYLTTYEGISISSDSGATWISKETLNGYKTDVVVVGERIIVGTLEGLAISSNAGETWNKVTTTNGLGSNIVKSVFVKENDIYVGTANGLAISNDSGMTWKNRIISSSTCSSVSASSVFVSSNTIYVGTGGCGLAVSNDGGATWSTTDSGDVSGVYGSVSSVFVSGKSVFVGNIGGLGVKNPPVPVR